MVLLARAPEKLSEQVTGEGLQVKGKDGQMHIGLEGCIAAPGATVQTEGAFGGGK